MPTDPNLKKEEFHKALENMDSKRRTFDVGGQRGEKTKELSLEWKVLITLGIRRKYD